MAEAKSGACTLSCQSSAAQQPKSRSTRRPPHWLEGLPAALDYGMLLIIVGRRIAVQPAPSRLGILHACWLRCLFWAICGTALRCKRRELGLY